jgi:cyclic pyranopterin phosphate synthase
MFDVFERKINYLRISVTDKCNLRCVYCMPAEGVPLRRHDELLSFEQIAAVVRAGVKLGITKVRLTGGEPLVKRDIAGLVKMIKEVPGLRHLGMTTNGVLLKRLAADLKKAGLDSLNISLDSLNPERYRALTRGGELGRVLDGIEAARALGFPLKINTVVLNDTGEDEITVLRRFCSRRDLSLQLINHYALTEDKLDHYQFDRPPDCRHCNRIRLLADGRLKPCLHSDTEIPLDFHHLEESLRRAVLAKPQRGSSCTKRNMVEIGG